MENLKSVSNTEFANLLNTHILKLLNGEEEHPSIKLIYEGNLYTLKIDSEEKHNLIEELILSK